IDGRGNGGAIAVNRLVAAGAAPAWITAPATGRGLPRPPGDIVVAHAKGLETVVPTVIASIASELGLRADGMRGKIPANLRPVGRARVGLYKPWLENIDAGGTRWGVERDQLRF